MMLACGEGSRRRGRPRRRWMDKIHEVVHGHVSGGSLVRGSSCPWFGD